ncbi:MAG: 1-acyl-sn-glycerol-3-phosphate acyltransferase [Balneolaceae bacterium]|nr:MAG: 1-acyl-sn-glycerol-3-phosphate acyltransferase [Balneolaceae bacterium]
MQYITSVFTWAAIILLVLVWLPVVAISRLFDRDPVRYRTGRVFRTLGLLISKINPNWNVEISGAEGIDDRKPYVVVSNHLSNADIPVISNLPWEMKWIAKEELFKIPIVGWMMNFAGDISVDRSSSNKRVGVFNRCAYYLERNTSVIFFPEGTRSRSGKLNRFALGAFDLAIREQVDLLPLVLDGTQECLPKKSWLFEPDVYVKLKVLSPVSTKGMKPEDSIELMESVRSQIKDQLSVWRGEAPDKVDGTL